MHGPLSGGFLNPVTRVGLDKSSYARYRRRLFNALDLEDYADAYCHDDVVQTVAARTPKEMLARGYELWQGQDRRQDLEDELGPDGLDLTRHLRDALTWERLFGGAALLVGADDGRPKEEPLNPSTVRDVRFVADLERRDVSGNIKRDRVLRLLFHGGSFSVHRSRLVLFGGSECPPRESAYRQGWGVGAVEYAWDEIADFNLTWKSFRALLADGNQAVIYMKNLIDLISSKGKTAVQDRMYEIDTYRSIVNALLLDQDGEKFERVATNLTGYSDALQKSFERLAMAVRMPVTVLVGVSPAGLNATGESDLTLWYDSVAQERAQSAEPAILHVARLVARARGTDPEGLRVEWPPFWQPDAKEEADVESTRASTAKIVIEVATAARDAGHIMEEQLRAIVRAQLGIDE